MPSVKHRMTAAGQDRWDVRFYPRPGQAQVSKTFSVQADAERYAAAVQRAQELGEPVPEPHRHRRRQLTVGDLYLEFKQHELPNKAKRTQENYRDIFRSQVANPRYGVAHLLLSDVVEDPQLLDRWRNQVAAHSGRPTATKALSVLSGMFTYGVRHAKTTGLTVHPIRNGRVDWGRVESALVQAWPPLLLERVRAQLLANPEALSEYEAQRDALMWQCLYMAGMRPQDTTFTAAAVRERTILLTRQKSKRPRSPLMLADLGEDLRTFIDTHRIGPDEPLFSDCGDRRLRRARVRTGQPMERHQVQLWRTAWQAARLRAGGPEAVPYVGRHSYASLRLRAGMWRNLAELAQDMGHSIQVLQDTYAHEIAEFKGTEPVNADAELRAARQAATAA